MNELVASAGGAADAVLSDLPGIGGLGIGAILLALVFRTLWRQDAGWKLLLDQERVARADADQNAREARREAVAAHSRADAAERRADDAMREAKAARAETVACQVEHERTNRKLTALVDHLRTLGIPVPPELS